MFSLYHCIDWWHSQFTCSSLKMTFTFQFSIYENTIKWLLLSSFQLLNWCHSHAGLGYDFSIMALVPFLHLQASEYEGQPLWRGSNALLLTAPFAKRCLLLQDVDLSPIAFHFFFALPCVGEMTSACKSMKCTSRSRAALARSRSRGAQALDSAPAPPSVLL